MPDYRRLISYIYEYEGTTKGKNVGFVKIEARNGQCRLQVNVKRIYMGGNAIGVYLLGRGGRKTSLGTLFVRNGTGEFRTTVDIRDVENSGAGMEQYYGLTVHDVKNEWRSYQTIWEDAVATGLEEEPTGEGVQEMNAAEVGGEPSSMSSETNAGEAVPSEAVPGENATDREPAAEADLDATAGPVAEEVLPGSSPEAALAMAEEAVDELEKEFAEAGEPPADTASALTAVMDHPALSEPAVPDTPVTSPELENPEVLRYLQETEARQSDSETIWQEMRKQYPKIMPFDYENGCEVLTIRPDDIGRLPRENWVYGNNSFLLHGYYNFRYLILARLNGPNPPVSSVQAQKIAGASAPARYLIGIPGHYYSSEKYMATMFGFPNFVLSKHQPPNDGRFGYWYTDIKM